MFKDSGWTYKRLRNLQSDYGIKNATIAEVLGINRSTLSHWKSRKDDEELPLSYWPPLEALLNECEKLKAASVESSSEDAIKLGIASLFGPAAIAGLFIGQAVSDRVSNKKAEIEKAQKTDQRECPYCAETIKKKAIFCKHCRRDIPPAE